MRAALAAALLAALFLAPAAEATGISDSLDRIGSMPPTTAPPVPGCTTYNFTQRVDHFSRHDRRTFQQRYTVCTAFWNKGPKEPLFMYLGNESPLPGAWPTIFSDQAREQGGLLLYAEHRYYGTSMPCGPEGLTNEGLKYLVVEQVLKDYEVLVTEVRRLWGVPRTAGTVCYGGSYGGNLAAYLRMTYPKTFHASLASSAVLTYLQPAAPYFKTKDLPYTPIMDNALLWEGGQQCASQVKLAYQTLQGPLSRTPAGRQQLATALRMCNPANITSADDVNAVAYNIRDFWWGNFQVLFRANPKINTVKLLCKIVTAKPATPLGAVEGMAQAYISGSELDPQCIPGEAAIMPFSERDPRPTSDPTMLAWMYQCCREGWVVSTHMTSKYPSIYGAWDMPFPTFAKWCKRVYGLRHPPTPPRQYIYTERMFRGVDKLILSNGQIDPWAGGGILSSPARGVPAIVTPGASHRQDLSAVQPGNTAAFNATQAQIKAWIRKWVVLDHRYPC